MAPSIHRRTRKRKVPNSPRKPRFKKQLMKKPEKEEAPGNLDISDHESACSSLSCLSGGGDASFGGCSTPKGKRFKIPEISTCPWAPQKQRIANGCNPLRKIPIAFFTHPDVELFFSYALRDNPARVVCNL